jgi:predicted secreted protein
MARWKPCRMLLSLPLLVAAGSLMAIEPADVPKKKPIDPNEKVCETWHVLGSRLAVRRVCATRAEWADRRQRERDIIDRTQTQRCATNPATGLCG